MQLELRQRPLDLEELPALEGARGLAPRLADGRVLTCLVEAAAQGHDLTGLAAEELLQPGEVRPDAAPDQAGHDGEQHRERHVVPGRATVEAKLAAPQFTVEIAVIAAK
ncbi:MAG: hypothetical protein ACOVOI_00465 [Hyphomicrobiales bacterium]